MPARREPTPDGTVQADETGRCLFCARPADHVHPEPRPNKRARKTDHPAEEPAEDEE